MMQGFNYPTQFECGFKLKLRYIFLNMVYMDYFDYCELFWISGYSFCARFILIYPDYSRYVVGFFCKLRIIFLKK